MHGFLLHVQPNLLVFLPVPNLLESLVSETYHSANCRIVIASKDEFLWRFMLLKVWAWMSVVPACLLSFSCVGSQNPYSGTMWAGAVPHPFFVGIWLRLQDTERGDRRGGSWAWVLLSQLVPPLFPSSHPAMPYELLVCKSLKPFCAEETVDKRFPL